MPDTHEIIVMDRDSVMKLWLTDRVTARAITEAQAEKLWREHRERARTAAENAANVDDGMTLIRQMRELRTPVGRVVYKRYGGKMHVIIKGNPRVRSILTGTKYGVRNAKVVGLGIGRHGAMASAKGGTYVTCILLTAYNIADFVMRDEATLGQLIGKVASDIVKTVIAGAVGFAVAATLGSLAVVSSFAWGPFVLGAVAGYFVGKELEKLDTKYKLTEKLIATVERAIDRYHALVEQGRRNVRQAAREAVDVARWRVLDLLAEAVRSEVQRRLPPLPRLLPRF